MRNRFPVLALAALALLSMQPLLVGAQSDTTTSKPPKDQNDDGYDGPQGQADEGPAFSGIIIGLLFIGILTLMFVGYLRFRD